MFVNASCILIVFQIPILINIHDLINQTPPYNISQQIPP